MSAERIETARLVLRPPQMVDAEAMAEHLDDFGVSGNLARVPHPYHLSDARAWLRAIKPGLAPNQSYFTVEMPGFGCIGAVGFHQREQGTVLGYWLGRPYWGRGLMTEAASAAIDHLFSRSDALTIYSGVFHFNLASLAVQRKLGFVETGRSIVLCLARDRELEHIDTELTRAAWTQKP